MRTGVCNLKFIPVLYFENFLTYLHAYYACESLFHVFAGLFYLRIALQT